MNKFIPLDKSWVIRMGFLDVASGHKNIISFLDSQNNLNDDLLALKKVCEEWDISNDIHVGESGTIYRLFKFASWKLGLNKNFILEKSLKDRSVCNDPTIVNLRLEELLKLDNGTSQWATASVLLGNTEILENIPYKLQVTYDALLHWSQKRKKQEVWEARHDQTILKQAETFQKIMKGEKPDFECEQAEDYCFGRIFGYITKEEGEKRWPALRGHETDRIKEMEKTIKQLRFNLPVDSKDHRVIQSVGMYIKLHKLEVEILYPHTVNKTWPQFWEFLDIIKNK